MSGCRYVKEHCRHSTKHVSVDEPNASFETSGQWSNFKRMINRIPKTCDVPLSAQYILTCQSTLFEQLEFLQTPNIHCM